MKILILDSGTLINLSMNGLLDLFEKLKSTFNGKIIITKAVKYETIDRPLNIQRFELGALKVKGILDKGILEMPESIGISEQEISKIVQNLMDKANHSVSVNGKWVPIVSEGEISCLALSHILSEKGIENIIAIDERTTRIMCENPRTLEQLMSERLHQRVKVSPDALVEFKNYKFIRSSELVYVAYKKGVLGLEGKKALEAALYATKFKGAAISFEEIEELKKL